MKPSFRYRVAAALALLTAISAHAGEPVLKEPWIRPALAGKAAERAYVDITADTDMVLVGASTPVAKKVEIVVLSAGKDGTPDEKTVPSLALPAGKTTRLAFRGDHLRFVDITKSFTTGESVPLTLNFKDAAGKTSSVSAKALVRGFLVREDSPAAESRAMPGETPAPKSAPAMAPEPAKM